MRRAHRLWLLWLLAMLAPVAQADDVKSPAKKPAPSSTPATTTATVPKPVASNASRASTPIPATGADDEFLEFLGSVDAETGGQDWIDYLAQTDVSKVAKAKKTPPEAAKGQ